MAQDALHRSEHHAEHLSGYDGCHCTLRPQRSHVRFTPMSSRSACCAVLMPPVLAAAPPEMHTDVQAW